MQDKFGNNLSFNQIIHKGGNRLYNYLADFSLMLIRWVGFIPFHFIRNLIYRLSGIELGKGSTLHMWANFYSLKNIQIGQDTIIGNRVFLDGRDKIEIGNHVDIASEVMIYNSQHDIDSADFRAILKPVRVSDYVFIGPRAIILPGVSIGRGAIIAAGAIVSQDVAEMAVVGGVPAREIRKRQTKSLNYKLGRARLFQ